MKVMMITLLMCLVCLTANAQEPKDKQHKDSTSNVVITTYPPIYEYNKNLDSKIVGSSDECSQANLILALQAAVRQLPKESSGVLYISSGVTSVTWDTGTTTLAGKYSNLSYLERLKAIAADKEKEAKEARELADKEENRIKDVDLIKRTTERCLPKVTSTTTK